MCALPWATSPACRDPDALTPPSPQYLHRLEILITRGAEGRTGKVFVAEMTEEKSLELASKLVSEGFVFFVRRSRATDGEDEARPATCSSRRRLTRVLHVWAGPCMPCAIVCARWARRWWC